jgi:tetratricopeptide (TPR) repeat protein
VQEDSPRPGRADYLDFDLEIGTGTGRDYPVAVLDSPAGEARGSMHFPFDRLALENRLLTLQNALLRSGGAPRRTLSSEEQAVQDFGRELFEALFTPEVRSCFDVSLREADQQGKGLRLKLRIQSPEMAVLPWEYLYHPGQAEYVSLSTRTPIVRYLEMPQRIQPLAVAPPLRILGMIASPSDLPSLDVEREKERIERAIRDLRGRGLVELEWLPGQTWRDLLRAMRQGDWHILHFVGHGGFDRQTGEGLIVLADREGRAARFHAKQLGRLLANHASLRLVLLNSCEGAKGSERDMFSSTAAILVRRGIPAVLAMQYEITDDAAIEFARQFYEALADGIPVDGAMAEARMALSFAVANTVEWGTPVLYMRTPDGVLFRLTEAPRAEAPTPAPPADEELEQQLRHHYTAGLSAFWLEEWDRACGHFQAIVEARPDYQDAADKLAEARRQQEWSELYEQAQAAQKTGNWNAAISALEELVAEKPDYKDAAALLEAMNRQKRLADLYAQARQLHQAGRWQAVVNVFARIAALDPQYPDPGGLLSSAEREVAEQKRQGELDDLYSHALRAMDAGQWAEARRLLIQIQEMETSYRETERLLAKAEAEIASSRKPAALAEAVPPKARLPRWAIAAIGGMAVIALIVAAVLMGDGFGGMEPTATPTPTTAPTPEATDRLSTEAVRVTPDTGGARSVTETADAVGRMGMTATAEAMGWQATQTAIAAATDIDVAVRQTAEAWGTRMASEATQTALIRPTDTPEPPSTDLPESAPTERALWQQGKIAFVSAQPDHNRIYVRDLIEGSSIQLPEEPGAKNNLGPWWSPDGTWLAFYTRIDAGDQVMITGGSGDGMPWSVGDELQADFTSSPTWSPDGRRIVCYGTKGNTYFFILDAFSGHLETQLDPGTTTARLPAWSPNDDFIAFSSDEDGNWDIYTLSLAGGTPINLTRNSAENYAPAWSPDGKWTAYQSDLNRGGSHNEIWIMDPTGRNQRRVTYSPIDTWSRAPTWSPDGLWIAFVSNQAGSIGADYGELFVVSIETGDIVQLTDTGGRVYDWRPSWGP